MTVSKDLWNQIRAQTRENKIALIPQWLKLEEENEPQTAECLDRETMAPVQVAEHWLSLGMTEEQVMARLRETCLLPPAIEPLTPRARARVSLFRNRTWSMWK